MACLNVPEVNPLPPGWDCKYDHLTGKRYYINYFTRHTSMDDPRIQQTESIPLQDFSSAANHRLGLMMGTNSLKRQQSASSDNKQAATDQTVAKISSMFPTVSETHIRTLLLKYLKSVFPVVEETVLLDTLSSSDNNVHHATQTLEKMGFDKRATPSPRVCLQKQTPSTQSEPSSTPRHPPPARMKSVEEKQEMKVRLREKHPNVAERVVSIALDSVDYVEEKADQILSMAEDKPGNSDVKDNPISSGGHEVSNEIIIEEPSQPSSPESPPYSNKDGKNTRSMDDTDIGRYHSLLTRPPVGPNPKLPRGPNQSLLLVSHRPDYVAWCGSGGLARGPNSSLCEGPSSSRGPDPTLRKGPRAGLARGSIYSQLAALSLAESRGK